MDAITDDEVLDLVEDHFGPGSAEICRERIRHKTEEGWSDAHDDAHDNQELARAAACYANPFNRFISRDGISLRIYRKVWWPFNDRWWKPDTTGQEDTTTKEYLNGRVNELRKAGSMVAAEIDRINRIIEE